MTTETKPLRAYCNGYECIAAHSEEEAHAFLLGMDLYEPQDVEGDGWSAIPDETILRDEDGKPTEYTIAGMLGESEQTRHLYSCEV